MNLHFLILTCLIISFIINFPLLHCLNADQNESTQWSDKSSNNCDNNKSSDSNNASDKDNCESDNNDKEKDKDKNGNEKDKCNGESANNDKEKNKDKDDEKKKDRNDKDKDKNDKEKKDEPPKIGNFSLPVSQQPGPLVSFGENIIEKGQLQLFLFGDYIKTKNGYRSDLIPAILYGITDEFSVFINFPFSPGNKQDQDHSSGLEDWFIQLEYAFYNNSTKCDTTQATMVGALFFPTGSSHKVPPTGFGSPSLFFGLTYNRTGIYWFHFLSYGVNVTTLYHGTRFGNQYLYEGGLGRCFWTPPGWIFAWMVELNGLYSERNLIDGVIDPDSGGHLIYVTPSLWISSKKLIFQFGVGFPAYQDLFGQQPRQYYTIDFNIGWTF